MQSTKILEESFLKNLLRLLLHLSFPVNSSSFSNIITLFLCRFGKVMKVKEGGREGKKRSTNQYLSRDMNLLTFAIAHQLARRRAPKSRRHETSCRIFRRTMLE